MRNCIIMKQSITMFNIINNPTLLKALRGRTPQTEIEHVCVLLHPFFLNTYERLEANKKKKKKKKTEKEKPENSVTLMSVNQSMCKAQSKTFADFIHKSTSLPGKYGCWFHMLDRDLLRFFLVTGGYSPFILVQK